MINDIAAFLDYKRKLNVDLVGNNGNRDFPIALNIPTGLYYKTLAEITALKDSTNAEFQIDTIASIVSDFLSLDNNNISIDWVIENISTENQLEIITKLMEAINDILKNECFVIPDLEVKKESEKSEDARKREQIKNEIQRLNEIVSGKFVNLMDDISVIVTKTSNSYKDVMDMPIFIFKDLVKTVVINELRNDDDFNLAYLKDIMKKLNVEYSKNSGTEEKADNTPPKLTGANKAKLLSMLS